MRIRLITPDSSLPIIEKDLVDFKKNELKRLNEKGYQVYFYPNGTTKKLDTNLSGKDVDLFEWIFMDMDLKDQIYKSKEEFISLVKSCSLFPTKIIDSGHGIHVYWKINNLTRDSLLDLQHRLIQHFRTDASLGTVAHLMRMPGYLNTKSPHKEDWILSVIVEQNENAYNVEDFSFLPPISEDSQRKIAKHLEKLFGEKSPLANILPATLPERFEKDLEENPSLQELFLHPKDRSKADMKLMNVLYIKGYTKDEATQVMFHTLKGQEKGEDYVRSTVDRVYLTPLTPLDMEFDSSQKIATNEHLLKQKQTEIFEYELDKKYQKTLKQKEIDKRKGVYSLIGTRDFRKRKYEEDVRILEESIKNRLYCVTPKLTELVPLLGVELILIGAKSGSGKCFAKGTKIRMFDGTTKNVEDIENGELVMGADSKPRVVSGKTHGTEEMFDIIPVKGEKFTVNKSHILSLRCSQTMRMYKNINKNDIINLSVEDYLKKPQAFKNIFKQYRTGVEFEKQPVLLDPYFLGIWLGDGSSSGTTITTADSEVVNYLYDYVDKLKIEHNNQHLFINVHNNCNDSNPDNKSKNYTISSGNTGKLIKNPIRQGLQEYNLINNKHIPFEYFKNDRKIRLQLLAGLVDSDGSNSQNGIDFVFKNERLANDVVNLCRSLGFAAYIKPCKKTCTNNGKVGDYFRISVSGHTDKIHTKVPHKMFKPRKQIKNVLNVGFTVKSIGMGEYYGFQVDGDHLFLLEDYTVVHNTSTSVALVDPLLLSDKRILYLSNEERGSDFLMRLAAIRRGLNVNDRNVWSAETFKEIREEINYLADLENLMVVDNYVSGADLSSGREIEPLDLTNLDQLRTVLESTERDGLKFDLLILDYISKVGTNDEKESEWQVLYKAIKFIEEWGKRTATPSVVFTQLKEANEGADQSFKARLPGSKRMFDAVTNAIELQTDYETQETLWVCHKLRYGLKFRHILKFHKGKYFDLE